MTITAAITNAYKADIQDGVHQPGDDYRIALYSSSATLNVDTAAYTATGEVVGTGYTAGGKSLSGRAVGGASNVRWVDFSDPVWSGASFTARGALIYNATRSNKAIAVLDFGADISASGAPFTVEFPAPAATTALIRIG